MVQKQPNNNMLQSENIKPEQIFVETFQKNSSFGFGWYIGC